MTCQLHTRHKLNGGVNWIPFMEFSHVKVLSSSTRLALPALTGSEFTFEVYNMWNHTVSQVYRLVSWASCILGSLMCIGNSSLMTLSFDALALACTLYISLLSWQGTSLRGSWRSGAQFTTEAGAELWEVFYGTRTILDSDRQLEHPHER